MTEEAPSILENSTQKIQEKNAKSVTKKDELIGKDVAFIEQAVVEYDKVDPYGMIPSITNLITARRLKMNEVKCTKDTVDSLIVNWKKSILGIIRRKNTTSARIPSVPIPHLDGPFPIPRWWWYDWWEKIDHICYEIENIRRVSRKLNF